MNAKLLEGVRIVDFCWIGAGAYATKILADFGAEVIKIESSAHLDSLREAPPYKDGKPGVNRSGYFADRNSSKRSMTVNMKKPGARELVLSMVAKSDVVANNFTPGVMERFGLDYESVRAAKPDIIYLSMSMQGSDGPESKYLGYGAGIAAISGLQELTGLPGREPAGTGTNYPDHVPNPCHAAFAVLAALRHRRRTGEGQRIDLAQLEPTVALLGPTLLDLVVNGNEQGPVGNAHPSGAPHGVYPVQADDRWIAISAMRPGQWEAMARVLGLESWAKDAPWNSAEGRLANREALDERIAHATAQREGRALMEALQVAGVPAGVVNDAGDVLGDPQLLHRAHWVTLQHAEMGDTTYNSPPFRFSRTPAALRSPAPLLGEHTRQVCEELLGMDSAQYRKLMELEVLK